MDYMSLLSESQQNELKDRLKEVQKFAGYDVALEVRFMLQDGKELFVEFMEGERVAYRMMFKVNQKVGRPAVGTTKKVSLTLPDEVWHLIATKKEEWGVSQSQALRMMIESYFYPDSGSH